MDTEETRGIYLGCERLLVLQWPVKLAHWVDLEDGEKPAGLLKLSTLFLFWTAKSRQIKSWALKQKILFAEEKFSLLREL